MQRITKHVYVLIFLSAVMLGNMWPGLVLFVGIALFARGFLPPPPSIPGFATDGVPVPPQFDRMIFMVVDALRSDFAFSAHSSNFRNLHKLIREGHALPFTAYASPPTVTLPRLKGLTTGAASNFLDAVINIAESDSASALTNVDSWVKQLEIHNKRIHLYGDDTWIKLFPGAFTEVDGTSSFYVSDFTEVDNNVTRHLNPLSDDFDALILHYLGLDHIGHKGGPESPFMAAKQQEMDDIVSSLYNRIDDRTVIVLVGDHGMNDVGNHGGASTGETSAAVAFLSPKFSTPQDAPLESPGFDFYDRIQQEDIVTTISVLLGLPIPKNSLGVVIPKLLEQYSETDKVKLLEANCKRLELEDCSIVQLREIQQSKLRASSSYIMEIMYAGIAVLTCAVLLSLWRLKSAKSYSVKTKLVWLSISVLYFAAMLGSSTVEEEHYYWYWIFSGGAAWLTVKDWPCGILLLSAFRIIRGWHSTGQKWSALYDTAGFLNNNPELLWFFIGIYALTLAWRLPRSVWAVLGCLFGYKLCAASDAGEWVPFTFENVSLIPLARLVFVAILGVMVWQRSMTSFELLLVMQTRPSNIPLLGVCVAVCYILDAARVDQNSKRFFYFAMQHSVFFASGGSNSVATVDLSQAYNGVSSYSIPIVALLTYLSNFSGPLYCSFASPRGGRVLTDCWYSFATLGVALSCLVLRQHLFIWTVFSPKLLYNAAWIVHHFISDR